MILFIHGEDTYRSHQRLQYLKEGFQKKYDIRGHYLTYFEDGQFALEDFHKAVVVQGLLSTKRLVIVKRLVQKGKKDICEKIVEYLQKPVPDDVILIFWESGSCLPPKKWNIPSIVSKHAQSLAKFLLAQKHVEFFPVMTSVQIQQWIAQEARKLGSSFDSQAATMLVGLVGTDLWQLHNEVTKLANYAHGRVINSDDVKHFVTANFSENIFAFTDALSTRNQKKALELLHEQIESGLSESYILSMIARQIKILLNIVSSLQEGVTVQDLAKHLGLHPFVVQKSFQQAKLFSLPELTALYAELLHIDTTLKTTGVNPRMLIEMFIVKLCEKRLVNVK